MRPETQHLACAGLVLAMAAAGVRAEPGYGEPLTITTGTVYRVGTVAQLKNAVNLANANAPATILVSNGTYILDVDMLQITNHNIIIRSLSGDRDAVVIRGPGEGASAGIG
ncbi:MAG: hypothetical protein JXB04_02410, partial [Kiritimatiellae bacterium]|nr:hypothetical protein [Kiritimatiellia bacterium]